MNHAARVSRLLDGLLAIGAAVSGVIMVAIMAMVCLKVFVRYVLGYGWIGVDQVSGMLLLYITFLGAAWVLSREEHVTIDIVFANLPKGVQRVLLVVNSLICAAVCLLLCIYATVEVVQSLRRGVVVAAELEMPRAVSLIVIPIGFLFLWIQFIRRAWRAHLDGSLGEPGVA